MTVEDEPRLLRAYIKGPPPAIYGTIEGPLGGAEVEVFLFHCRPDEILLFRPEEFIGLPLSEARTLNRRWRLEDK